MNGGLRLVHPLRWGDVKCRECGCEQFGARDVGGFDRSHDDADERESAISSSQLYTQEEAVILSSLIMVMGAHGTRQWRDIRSQLMPSCRIWLLQVRAARANGSTLIQPGFIR